MPADGRAVRREHRARHDRRRRRRARAASRSCCASRASSAILGVPVALERQREILQALDFGVAEPPRRPERERPAGAPDDVTREVDLIEEVARIDGLERLPATLPARRGAAGRLSHAQRVRRARRGRARRARPARDRRMELRRPGLLDRLRLPAEDPMRRVVTLENPLSDGPVDHAPDADGLTAGRGPPERLAQRARTSPCSSRAPSTGPPPASAAADEHHALGGAAERRTLARARGAASAAESDFFAAKGLLEGLLGRFHVPFTLQAARRGRSCTRGAAPRCLAGRAHARLRRRGAPARRRRVGPRAHGRLRDRPRAARARARRSSSPSAAFGAFPSLRQDLAVTLPARRARRRACSTPCARPAARCSTTRGSSTSTPARRWGRAGARSRWR